MKKYLLLVWLLVFVLTATSCIRIDPDVVDTDSEPTESQTKDSDDVTTTQKQDSRFSHVFDGRDYFHNHSVFFKEIAFNNQFKIGQTNCIMQIDILSIECHNGFHFAFAYQIVFSTHFICKFTTRIISQLNFLFIEVTSFST